MRAGLAFVGLVAGAVLASCAPETAEWRKVCVDGENQLIGFFPMSCGQNCTIQQPQYMWVCYREEWKCTKGKDGSTTCPEPKPE